MQLNSISITPSAIIMRVSANKETDDINDLVESKITAKEAPLDSLTNAWAHLPSVFCEIMELTETDAKGKTKYPYATGLTITKMSIRRTKQGTRSVIFHATKQLECRRDFLHVITSPCVQIDKAADGESGAIEIDKKWADKVATAIHEAERYMGGDRSQTMLDFDKAKSALQATADIGQQKLGAGF
jgi:hypothetical protein